jgi:iron complex outermembrane receptor protein/vitamin B12 transporter
MLSYFGADKLVKIFARLAMPYSASHFIKILRSNPEIPVIKKQLYLSICAATILSSAMAFAQPTQADENTTPTVETVIVSGARIANTQAVSAAVLDQQDIELRNSASAVDLLRGLPGLDLVQPGGPGGVTELFIRGAESNFAIVTVDGVRVNDTTNSRGGSFDLSGINPDDIERVEILKGPLSAIYGSDALAGALNIVTKKPAQEPQISLRATGGSDGYQRSYLSFSGANDGGLGASISVARLDSGEPVEGSTSLTDSVRTNVQWAVNENRQLNFSAGYVERDRTSYPTGGGGLLFAPRDDLETGTAKDTSAQVGWREQVNEALVLDVQASYFNRDEQLDSPTIPEGVYDGVPAMTSDSEMERKRLIAHGVYTLTPEFTLAFGADYEEESGRNNSVIDFGFPMPSNFDLKRTNKAVFIEGHYRVENGINAFVSSRLDKPDEIGSQTSSKIALSYPLAEYTRIGASWGDAFKLPSFYAVGDQLVGNPDLLSETSETVEVFVQQAFANNRVRLNATAFQSQYDELIDFDFTTFQLVNRSSVEVDGVELEVIVNPTAEFEVGIHATQTDYDTRLNGRGEWRGGVFAEWNPDSKWQGRLHVSHTGKRPSASSETGDVMLDAYQRVDAVLIRKVGVGLDVSLSIDNIFDEDYQEEIGFPAAGRGFRVGVSVTL